MRRPVRRNERPAYQSDVPGAEPAVGCERLIVGHVGAPENHFRTANLQLTLDPWRQRSVTVVRNPNPVAWRGTAQVRRPDLDRVLERTDRRGGQLSEPVDVDDAYADVDNSMDIAQQEVFGPVLVLIAYDGDDDAVAIANDSEYGLSGGVFSASTQRGLAFARRVRTGSIGVNGGLWYGADSPFGGYKSGGIGRQNGVEGFEQYLETKAVAFGA